MKRPLHVVVSRHPAALAWLREELPEIMDKAEVINGNATKDDVFGRIVIGNVPYHLGCYAFEVWAIEFNGPPPRGAEYTVEDMRAAGAHVAKYQVNAVP